jgi:putative copper export protein
MSAAYYVNVFIHVLAAMVWLGGMLFVAAVGAPVLRQVEEPELRQSLFRSLGVQFRLVGWICIAVLLVTGVLNLQFRGLLSADVLGSADFWRGAYGRALFWKLLFVVVMVTLAAIHDFWMGPRASRLEAGSSRALRHRAVAAWMGRANALVGLALLWVAVRLARGG